MDFRNFGVKIKTVWSFSRIIWPEMAATTLIIGNQFRKIDQICEAWIYWLQFRDCIFEDDLGNKSCLNDAESTNVDFLDNFHVGF